MSSEDATLEQEYDINDNDSNEWMTPLGNTKIITNTTNTTNTNTVTNINTNLKWSDEENDILLTAVSKVRESKCDTNTITKNEFDSISILLAKKGFKRSTNACQDR